MTCTLDSAETTSTTLSDIGLESRAVVLANNNAYFSVLTAEQVGDVYKVPLVGGTPSAATTSNLFGAWGLDTDGIHVYYADRAGTVGRFAAGGVTLNVLETSQPEPVWVAVNDSLVYWANRADGSVMRRGKATNDSPVVHSQNPTGLLTSIDATNDWACWTSEAPAAVRCSEALGGTTVLIQEDGDTQTAAMSVSIDGDHLFWSDSHGVFGARIEANSEVTQFSDPSTSIGAVAHDDLAIYWVSHSGVFKVAKPPSFKAN